MFLYLMSMIVPISSNSSVPLSVEEVMRLLRIRWGVAYDLQLVLREKRLYLQIMWGYLEQQSFPMDEKGYRSNLNKVLEVINRLDQAHRVREWLVNENDKPRVGRALTLPLKGDERLEEFVL